MILTNATVVTLWGEQPLVDGALVAIEGKTIVDFGKVGKLVDRYEDPETLDVGGRVVMPGLVDAHAHLYRSLAPASPLDRVRTFRELQEKFWWRYTRALGAEDVYWSALVGLLNSVRGGFTSIVDHHSSPNAVGGSLDAVWRAFADVGVRGCLSYEISDREGEAAARAGLDENRRFVEQCRAVRSDMMAGLVGLDGSYAVSDETLREASETVKALRAGVHVPVSEDISEVLEARARYQRTPVQRLVSAGALGAGSLAVHCVHLEPDDYDLLKGSGATVVQCPQANEVSAAGIVDLPRLSSSGVPLAMGTAGFSPCLFEEFRASVLQQRMRGRSLSEAMELAYRVAFSGNADLTTALFGRPLGRIKPGARADLIVLDYQPSTPLNAANIIDHLFCGLGRAPVKAVIINGRVVYRDGAFAGLDEPRVRALARERAKGLWQRM